MQYLSPALNIMLHETMPGLIIRFVIAGGISVLIAAFSRKYFEEFFLKFKDYKYAQAVKSKILSKLLNRQQN